MIEDENKVQFIRCNYGSFVLRLPWVRPPSLPGIKVRVPPGLLRLFYPLYNTYAVCGKHGGFYSYTRFWHSKETKLAIAPQIDRCIGVFDEVAKTYDIVNNLGLGLSRKYIDLYVDSTLKIPPQKDSDKIKILSEMLSDMASCLKKVGKEWDCRPCRSRRVSDTGSSTDCD